MCVALALRRVGPSEGSGPGIGALGGGAGCRPPDGQQIVTLDDVDRYWQGATFGEIFPEDTSRNMNTAEARPPPAHSTGGGGGDLVA